MSSDGKKSLGFKQIHFLPLSLLPLEINKALLIPRSFKFYLYFLPCHWFSKGVVFLRSLPGGELGHLPSEKKQRRFVKYRLVIG